MSKAKREAALAAIRAEDDFYKSIDGTPTYFARLSEYLKSSPPDAPRRVSSGIIHNLARLEQRVTELEDRG